MSKDTKVDPRDVEILQICLKGATVAEITAKVGNERFFGFLKRLDPFIDVGGALGRVVYITNDKGKQVLVSRGIDLEFAKEAAT